MPTYRYTFIVTYVIQLQHKAQTSAWNGYIALICNAMQEGFLARNKSVLSLSGLSKVRCLDNMFPEGLKSLSEGELDALIRKYYLTSLAKTR